VQLPTVMVVDDSLTVRKITGRLLEREGYRVITAKDGVDALEQLIDPAARRGAVADIEMPRMDGFDLVRNIRADARLKAPAGDHDHLAPGREAPPLRRRGRRQPLPRQALPGNVLLELIRGFVEHGPA
jgi:CheY-like chemotaxis protein